MSRHCQSSALAATPNLIALYQEDVQDAFEYIGLEDLDDPNPAMRMFHETGATAASYRIGLCSNYTDHAGCKEERDRMPLRSIFSIAYTKDSLCAEMARIASAYYVYPYESSPPTMDFNLGSDKLNDNPNERYYWESVRDSVHRAMITGFAPLHPPELVFLFGESATNTDFRSTLEDALMQMLDKMPKIVVEDPVYSPARGAAELAKRGGYF